MSNDIPTLSKATRAVSAEANFQPNGFQERVKARFYRRLSEMSHIYDKEAAFKSKDACVQLAGTERILIWLEKPEFAQWFVDGDRLTDVIQANQERSVQAILDVMQDRDSSDSDKLKAARLLLELGDKFPGRKQEVRFLDDRLNDMREAEVTKETHMLDAQLAQLETDVGQTSED